MIYSTSGEFIQALKDYKELKKKAEQWKDRYQTLYYLRYEKIRSPLDYDEVTKRKKDGTVEVIRQIKTGGTFNQEVASSVNEQLDQDIDLCTSEYSKLIVKMENTRDELKRIDEPLRKLLILRYMEHMKLKDVVKKSGLYLDESGMYKYIQRGLEKYYESDPQ